MSIVIGMGVSSAARTRDLEIALKLLPDLNFTALATIKGKEQNSVLKSACQLLSVSLLTFTADELEKMTPFLKNPSNIVFEYLNCHGVAEAAALAACGQGGKLLVEKTKVGGVTLAVARGEEK